MRAYTKGVEIGDRPVAFRKSSSSSLFSLPSVMGRSTVFGLRCLLRSCHLLTVRHPTLIPRNDNPPLTVSKTTESIVCHPNPLGALRYGGNLCRNKIGNLQIDQANSEQTTRRQFFSLPLSLSRLPQHEPCFWPTKRHCCGCLQHARESFQAALYRPDARSLARSLSWQTTPTRTYTDQKPILPLAHTHTHAGSRVT